MQQNQQQEPDESSIVIVDDTPDNLRLLIKILSEQGYRVRPVPNGQMALTAVQKEPPDLVLLDIMMPDIDGYEVCRVLKANDQTSSIPIIFLSALGEVFDKVKAFSLGGIDYITKPFQAEEVLVRVATHVSRQRLQKQLAQQNKQLHQVNGQLEQSVDELERRNLEMGLLNRMSAFLQRAESADEAMRLSLPFLEQLFLDYPGALYLLTLPGGTLEQVAAWGEPPPTEQSIRLEQCMAFAGGRVNVVEHVEDDLVCEHCPIANTLPYLCVQLTTRGEPLGLLHLRNGPFASDKARDHWQRLAMMVADHMALALSNLALRERLREQAIRDPLTGLFNRYYLDETLEREFCRATREHYPIGFMMLDIDHFKHYNDTYGHDAGDALLREMGSLLQRHIRRGDMVCRFGGEEFLIILPGASLDDTRQRAEMLRGAVQRMQVMHEDELLKSVTISVGVACFPDYGDTAEMMIAVVDDALYHAKAAGRNCVITALKHEAADRG